jgi:hypothetical protein
MKNIVFYDDDPINIVEVSKLKIKSILITNGPVNLNYKEADPGRYSKRSTV